MAELVKGVNCDWPTPRDHFDPTAYLAQWMIERGFATGHGDTFTSLLEQLSWQIEELRQKQE